MKGSGWKAGTGGRSEEGGAGAARRHRGKEARRGTMIWSSKRRRAGDGEGKGRAALGTPASPRRCLQARQRAAAAFVGLWPIEVRHGAPIGADPAFPRAQTRATIGQADIMSPNLSERHVELHQI